ncbi:hypothetical protein HDU76_010243 [Blyttiomyces sp. JEL0837]|nr:hypothetical protein HDU76_010243 [Blyttiomyces sp. JEL0837]
MRSNLAIRLLLTIVGLNPIVPPLVHQVSTQSSSGSNSANTDIGAAFTVGTSVSKDSSILLMGVFGSGFLRRRFRQVAVPEAWDKAVRSNDVSYLSDNTRYRQCSHYPPTVTLYQDPNEPAVFARKFDLDPDLHKSADLGTLSFNLVLINNIFFDIPFSTDPDVSYAQWIYVRQLDDNGEDIGSPRRSYDYDLTELRVGLTLEKNLKVDKITLINFKSLSIKMIDLLTPQGTRFIRSLLYGMVMAFVYSIFRWLSASPNPLFPEDATLTLFSGISNSQFQSDKTTKTLISLIYVGVFVATAPEQIALGIVTTYFLINIFSINIVENAFRKTSYSDIVYTRLLLKPASWESKQDLSFVPEHHRKPLRLNFVKRFSIVRIPPRLIASIMMMFLFTYVALVTVFIRIIDINTLMSCIIGLTGQFILQAFSVVAEIVGAISGTQSFGQTLSGALDDITGQIKAEVDNNFITKFYNMILYSAMAGSFLSILVLIFNIIDFVKEFYRDLERLRKGDYSRMGLSGCGIGGVGNGLVVVSIAASLILSMGQAFIVKRWFIAKLQVGDYKNKKGHPFVIDTKLPNLISGLLSFITQLTLLILASAIFAYRLDKRNQMSNFLLFRYKYAYYSSWLIQEHHHSNPILRAAIKILSDAAEDRRIKYEVDSDFDTPERKHEDRRRRNIKRWHLAYTLVRNPGLAKYRSHCVIKTIINEIAAKSDNVERGLAFQRLRWKETQLRRLEKLEMRRDENEKIKYRRVRGRGGSSNWAEKGYGVDRDLGVGVGDGKKSSSNSFAKFTAGLYGRSSGSFSGGQTAYGSFQYDPHVPSNVVNEVDQRQPLLPSEVNTMQASLVNRYQYNMTGNGSSSHLLVRNTSIIIRSQM